MEGTKFYQVSSGSGHAIDTDGNLWAWGSSNIGGVTGLPVKIMEGTKFSSVSAGNNFGFAIDIYGNVYGWGSSVDGRNGLGVHNTTIQPITRASQFSDITYISAGHANGKAIDKHGRLLVWGSNSVAQIGDGTTVSRPRFVHLMPARQFIQAGITWQHAHALDADGNLWSWGRCSFGGIGDGALGNVERRLPVQIAQGTLFSYVSAGHFRGHAIDINGNFWSWGENWRGTLGDGTTTDRRSPVQITLGIL